MLGQERAGQQPKRGATLDLGVKKNRKMERTSTNMEAGLSRSNLKMGEK